MIYSGVNLNLNKFTTKKLTSFNTQQSQQAYSIEKIKNLDIKNEIRILLLPPSQIKKVIPLTKLKYLNQNQNKDRFFDICIFKI